MPDKQMTLDAVLNGQDWARYAGPAADVRRRGERARRRRHRAVAVVAVVAAIGATVPVLTSASHHSARPTTEPTTYVTHLPHASGVPNLYKGPWTVIKSGVIGEGVVNGHHWQIAYEVIPSQSALNSEPILTCFAVTVDNEVGCPGYSEGDVSSSSNPGFSQYVQGTSLSGTPAPPLVVAAGSPPKGTATLALEWSGGRTKPVPVYGADGSVMTAFAFDPADPPIYILESGSYGERRIPVAGQSTSYWTFGV
jgi:hypothetical protein